MKGEAEDYDIQSMEAKETANRLPVGWLLLFWGLVIWGAFYLWAYSPALGGWSQAQDLEGGGAAAGTNLLATIAFTAIPTLAAVLIVMGQRKRKAP
jgi:hypothetical protein